MRGYEMHVTGRTPLIFNSFLGACFHPLDILLAVHSLSITTIHLVHVTTLGT